MMNNYKNAHVQLSSQDAIASAVIGARRHGNKKDVRYPPGLCIKGLVKAAEISSSILLIAESPGGSR
jgi:hypothetical protein